MPKFEIIIERGIDISDKSLKDLILKYFSNQQIEKLHRLGGRIQISVTAPFNDKKKKKNLIIDEQFLKDLQNDPNLAKEKLYQLSKKQLKEVAKLLNFPISSKANNNEVINSLMDFLESATKWLGISGSTYTNMYKIKK